MRKGKRNRPRLVALVKGKQPRGTDSLVAASAPVCCGLVTVRGSCSDLQCLRQMAGVTLGPRRKRSEEPERHVEGTNLRPNARAA